MFLILQKIKGEKEYTPFRVAWDMAEAIRIMKAEKAFKKRLLGWDAKFKVREITLDEYLKMIK